MKQFATPFAIKGTIDELKHIERLLFELGYCRKDGYNNQIQYIASGSSNTPVDELCLYSCLSIGVKREVINYNKENEELILALAAMVEGDIFHKGEYLKCIKSYGDQFTKDRLYKQRRDNNSSSYGSVIVDDNGTPNGVGAHFVKATKEEIFQHFNPIKGSIVMSEHGGTDRLFTTAGTFTNINIFTNKDMDKKIIGWNIKPGIDRLAALKAIGWEKNTTVSQYELKHESDAYKDAVKLGVLDALFVPVYGKESRSLVIGGRTFEFDFNRDTVSYNYNTTIYTLTKSDIAGLVDLYNSRFECHNLPYYIKTLAFGCDGQIGIEMSDIVKIFSELSRE